MRSIHFLALAALVFAGPASATPKHSETRLIVKFRKLRSGVYFYRVESSSQSMAGRLVVVR